MLIIDIMTQKNITKYKLSKNSGVPYATVNDICNGKAKLHKCSAKTIYKISKELGVSMENLLEPYLETRISFELFKSNVCHRLKELGDIDFIIETLENNDITKYYNKKWYPECFYLLAMLDYVSRQNDVALSTEYNEIRNHKLDEIIYPSSINAISKIQKSDDVKRIAYMSAIPEFARFNIVENEVRNVI